jgi:hypothetical protein
MYFSTSLRVFVLYYRLNQVTNFAISTPKFMRHKM